MPEHEFKVGDPVAFHGLGPVPVIAVHPGGALELELPDGYHGSVPASACTPWAPDQEPDEEWEYVEVPRLWCQGCTRVFMQEWGPTCPTCDLDSVPLYRRVPVHHHDWHTVCKGCGVDQCCGETGHV